MTATLREIFSREFFIDGPQGFGAIFSSCHCVIVLPIFSSVRSKVFATRRQSRAISISNRHAFRVTSSFSAMELGTHLWRAFRPRRVSRLWRPFAHTECTHTRGMLHIAAPRILPPQLHCKHPRKRTRKCLIQRAVYVGIWYLWSNYIFRHKTISIFVFAFRWIFEMLGKIFK